MQNRKQQPTERNKNPSRTDDSNKWMRAKCEWECSTKFISCVEEIYRNGYSAIARRASNCGREKYYKLQINIELTVGQITQLHIISISRIRADEHRNFYLILANPIYFRLACISTYGARTLRLTVRCCAAVFRVCVYVFVRTLELIPPLLHLFVLNFEVNRKTNKVFIIIIIANLLIFICNGRRVCSLHCAVHAFVCYACVYLMHEPRLDGNTDPALHMHNECSTNRQSAAVALGRRVDSNCLFYYLFICPKTKCEEKTFELIFDNNVTHCKNVHTHTHWPNGSGAFGFFASFSRKKDVH